MNVLAAHIAAIQSLGDSFTVVNAVLDLIFLVGYSLFARWWKSMVGTHLFIFVACLDAVWIVSAAHHLFGTGAWYLWTRAILYIAFVPLGVWRLWLLYSAQRYQHRADAKADERRRAVEQE